MLLFIFEINDVDDKHFRNKFGGIFMQYKDDSIIDHYAFEFYYFNRKFLFAFALVFFHHFPTL